MESQPITWAVVVTPAPSRQLMGSMSILGPYDDADEAHRVAMELNARGHDATGCPFYAPDAMPDFLAVRS